MNLKFSKNSGDTSTGEASDENKKRRSLLVLLLILVGGFTYLYFFTDLIKTPEAQKAAEAPAAPEIVRMPLPPREGEAVPSAGKVPEQAQASKTSVPAAAAVPVPVPATKTDPAPTKPEPTPTVKVAAAPVPVQSKPKDEPKTSGAAKQIDKKPQPVAPKPAGTSKNVPAAKDSAKKPESGVNPKKAVSDSWSLNIGNYILEEAMSADMGRVRKAGFEPVIKPSTRKKASMNRLFVSEFNDRATAQATLEKLKQHTSDGFVIEQGGRFAVYAGSYVQSEAANSEIMRLKGSGISATIKHNEISIPSRSLSVGPFKNKKSAVSALGKLKSAGLKATLSQK